MKTISFCGLIWIAPDIKFQWLSADVSSLEFWMQNMHHLNNLENIDHLDNLNHLDHLEYLDHLRNPVKMRYLLNQSTNLIFFFVLEYPKQVQHSLFYAIFC